jgi:RNA polymerase sigma-70 factor (ECF subfamily)
MLTILHGFHRYKQLRRCIRSSTAVETTGYVPPSQPTSGPNVRETQVNVVRHGLLARVAGPTLIAVRFRAPGRVVNDRSAYKLEAVTAAQRVDEFEALRPHLLAVGYRLTGTFADAEDAVQDAWLRWQASSDAPDNLRAWLTTVVSRLALDRLRSAGRRRETYVGEWLPEPVVTTPGVADPLSAVVANEDARYAAMLVLERLTPDQRVAFVLHDGFAVPFGEIASLLGTTDAAARQLASRARRIVGDHQGPVDTAHDEVVGSLLVAMAAGDMDAVIKLLRQDITFVGDSNGKARTAIHIITGADKVARFMFGLARRYGPGWLESSRLALVNGELGLYLVGHPGSDGYPPVQPRIIALSVSDGKVDAVWDVANPDKFTGSPLRSDAAQQPTEHGTRHRN